MKRIRTVPIMLRVAAALYLVSLASCTCVIVSAGTSVSGVAVTSQAVKAEEPKAAATKETP